MITKRGEKPHFASVAAVGFSFYDTLIKHGYSDTLISDDIFKNDYLLIPIQSGLKLALVVSAFKEKNFTVITYFCVLKNFKGHRFSERTDTGVQSRKQDHQRELSKTEVC